MNNKETIKISEENLNNNTPKNIDFEKIEKLTLVDLLRVIAHTEIKRLIALLILFSGICLGLIKTGQILQIESVGIPLNIPFKLNIIIGEKGDEFILSKRESDPIVVEKGKNGVIIRKKNEIGVFNEVGQLITSKAEILPIKFFDVFKIIPELLAQEHFDWKEYKNRNDFREIIKSDNTVVRTYSDGKKLEYKLDKDGQYIAGTLRWIN